MSECEIWLMGEKDALIMRGAEGGSIFYVVFLDGEGALFFVVESVLE